MSLKIFVRICRLAICASLAGIVGLTLPARSQDTYPSKPIRLVLGFTAGGGTDAIAREIAQKMSETLGVQSELMP